MAHVISGQASAAPGKEDRAPAPALSSVAVVAGKGRGRLWHCLALSDRRVLRGPRCPAWFPAGIGAGQMVNPVETDRLIYEDALQRASTSGNTQLVQRLEAVGPPPYQGLFNMANYTTIFTPNEERQQQLVRASGAPVQKPLLDMTDGPGYGAADQVGGTGRSWLDLRRHLRPVGPRRSPSPGAGAACSGLLRGGQVRPQLTAVLAEQYFNALSAPTKRWVWFEHSGHHPAH